MYTSFVETLKYLYEFVSSPHVLYSILDNIPTLAIYCAIGLA